MPAQPATSYGRASKGRIEGREHVVNEPVEGNVRRGGVLTLVQRSMRRRDYELRRGDRVVGRLRFPPGRRSMAQAEGSKLGLLVLTSSSGGIQVRSGEGDATVAAVEHERRGSAVIRLTQGPPIRWHRTGRWHRWAIGSGQADLLRFTAAQGLLRSSVRITAEQDIPEPAGMLLCLIGGFLALGELQAEIDGSAAVGSIAATGAG
jgi:hypothetical protein